VTSNPSWRSSSAVAGPERSARSPRAEESLIVKTAAVLMVTLLRLRFVALVVAALSARFAHQHYLADLNAFVQRFAHVVNGQRGDRGRDQGFHFDAGDGGCAR